MLKNCTVRCLGIFSVLAAATWFNIANSQATELWTVENIAGTGIAGSDGEGGFAKDAQLNNPFGVIRGPDNAIWFCEYSGQKIRRIGTDGKLVTIAGTGKTGYSGDGGPASDASFNLPHEIRFDSEGDLYIVDMANHAIRKIQMSTGLISTVVGNGQAGYSGDGGLAKHAQLKQPHSIQFGPDGAMYICDIGNHVVRRVDRETEIITTFAGTGKPGITSDGGLMGNPINGPRSLDFDAEGKLWLATREGNQVFRIDVSKHTIQHIAGTGESGFEGNGGPAKLAKLKGPKGIAIDRQGDVWLADTESHTVRRIDSADGTIDVILGNGEKGDGPIGNPKACKLARLHGIFVDHDGSILIGDSEAHRIRVLKKSEGVTSN